MGHRGSRFSLGTSSTPPPDVFTQACCSRLPTPSCSPCSSSSPPRCCSVLSSFIPSAFSHLPTLTSVERAQEGREEPSGPRRVRHPSGGWGHAIPGHPLIHLKHSPPPMLPSPTCRLGHRNCHSKVSEPMSRLVSLHTQGNVDPIWRHSVRPHPFVNSEKANWPSSQIVAR